jgi:hypothetical protein
MKTPTITVIALALMGCAIAQDVPPLPPLRGDAASLKDTMKFIQNKLPGRVNYAVYGHDNLTGADAPINKRTMDLSNVSAGADSCSISFHFRFDNGRGFIEDRYQDVSLGLVHEVTVTQMDQFIGQENAKASHPEVSVKVDPAVFLVRLKSPRDGFMFNFYDEELADRVAKALQHAMMLCGGGTQEPF